MDTYITISIDVEPDYQNYIGETYIGVKTVLPKLLKIMDKYNVTGDFFVTSKILEDQPDLHKCILGFKHNLGSHNYNHDFVCVKKQNLFPKNCVLPYSIRKAQEFYFKKGFDAQLLELEKATEIFHKIVGFKPQMFRAPNFSADHHTVKALEILGYKIDSSVLPGRVLKKWRSMSILDFRQAPRTPYHPSYDNINKPGAAKLLELPITSNPIMEGAPLGLSCLNMFGISTTLKAISISQEKSRHLTFLVHLCELIDPKQFFINSHPSFSKFCFKNFEGFDKLLEILLAKGYIMTKTTDKFFANS